MLPTILRATLTALIGVSLMSAGGCVAGRDQTRHNSGDAVAGSPQTAALIATFRFLFANNGSALKGGAASYCVGVGTRPRVANPAPDVMDALSDVEPNVVPASTCRTGLRTTDSAGRPSLLFNLTPRGCDATDDCLFNGGYYEGNISASGGNYRARRIAGVWTVAPEGPQAIS